MLKNEMQKRGKQEAYVEGTDYAEFRFTSGSIFDVIGGHPRGMRRNFGMKMPEHTFSSNHWGMLLAC